MAKRKNEQTQVQNTRQEPRESREKTSALALAMKPINSTIASLLNEAVDQDEDLSVHMEKGNTSMNLEYAPGRSGKRQRLAFEMES